MSAPQIEFAYPVNWPVGRPRTAIRKAALFRHEGRNLLFDQALRRFAQQVELVTPSGRAWRMRKLPLSINFELRAVGRPRAHPVSSAARPKDPKQVRPNSGPQKAKLRDHDGGFKLPKKHKNSRIEGENRCNDSSTRGATQALTNAAARGAA